jgi:Tol biopolymer transport system component
MPGGSDETRAEMIWINLDGTVEPVGAPVMSYSSVALSPDGTRIASGVWGANDAVFVYDLARNTSTRITFRGNCGGPQWSRDGRQIVYSSDLNGPLNFFTIASDGSGEPQKVSSEAVQENACYATIDGKPGMVFDSRGDIWFQPLSSDPPLKLVGSQFEETSPRISPDGRWLSYASNETGQQEIYIRPFPPLASGQSRWQVSVGGGQFSNWMPKSDALVYIRHSDAGVFRVPFQPGATPQIGSPERLFTIETPQHNLQPTPDGKRFLALRSLPTRYKANQVYVILNWLEELRAKVPSK